MAFARSIFYKMKQEDVFIEGFMKAQLASLDLGDPEKVKTLLAFMGLETINRLKQGSYTEADLKKMAGEVTRRLHSGMESQKN